jgi:cytochrome b
MRLSMRVWDLPVRLFHAAVTLLLIVAVLTWRTHHMRWHILTGDALLVLLLWRIVWFVVGSETARWPAFLVAPLAGLGPRKPDDSFGHGAAGGWWILVMLALLALQIGSGLIHATRLHAIAAWLLLAAIALHLLFVAIAATRGAASPLRLMLTGKKRMPAARRAPRMAGPGLAALVLLCAAGAVLLVLRGLHL